MKTLLCLAALMLPLALTSCVGQQIPDAEFTARCVEWLKEHGKPPVDYLVSKFDEHTCVLVGEVHEVRQNCAFVAESLPRLFDEAGVLTFATEFLRARNTEAMNRIVTAPEYDEVAVIALMRDGPWPTWGFQGYADIFRAVWKINAEKLDDGPPLRVLGLDSDWEQHHLWFDDVTPTERIEILLARERTMVAAIADGPLAADSKVLVHCGYAHSVLSRRAARHRAEAPFRRQGVSGVAASRTANAGWSQLADQVARRAGGLDRQGRARLRRRGFAVRGSA